MVRWFFLAAGHVCMVLAVLGVFLPLLPTTPFVLLASACYLRSSKRFHDALHAHRIFGPLLRHWQESRSIPRRAKWAAVVMIALAMSISAYLAPLWWVRAGLALIGIGVAAFILTRPSPPPA